MKLIARSKMRTRRLPWIFIIRLNANPFLGRFVSSRQRIETDGGYFSLVLRMLHCWGVVRRRVRKVQTCRCWGLPLGRGLAGNCTMLTGRHSSHLPFSKNALQCHGGNELERVLTTKDCCKQSKKKNPVQQFEKIKLSMIRFE